jgi:hypothetical protein
MSREQPERDGVSGWWPRSGIAVTVPLSLLEALGLAPGACQRFRLVPEGAE